MKKDTRSGVVIHPVIPALGLRLEDCKFETSLSNLMRPYCKIKKKKDKCQCCDIF